MLTCESVKLDRTKFTDSLAAEVRIERLRLNPNVTANVARTQLIHVAVDVLNELGLTATIPVPGALDGDFETAVAWFLGLRQQNRRLK